jgi:hypothetical protein
LIPTQLDGVITGGNSGYTCRMSGSASSKPLICIYTNNEKNEFAIGFREDENYRAVTKVGDFYTRFVDAFESGCTDILSTLPGRECPYKARIFPLYISKRRLSDLEVISIISFSASFRHSFL